MGLTVQLTLQLYGRLVNGSGTKIQKKVHEKYGSVLPPQQDIVHPRLSKSTSRPDLGLGCFSRRWETIRTSCKALTNKLYQVRTSSDKPTRLEQCLNPP